MINKQINTLQAVLMVGTYHFPKFPILSNTYKVSSTIGSSREGDGIGVLLLLLLLLASRRKN